MIIIKKETIVMTCGGCPSQWDAYTSDGKYVYIRVRNGYFLLSIDNSSGAAFSGEPKGVDGVMSTEDMIDYVNNNNKGRIIIV